MIADWWEVTSKDRVQAAPQSPRLATSTPLPFLILV